MRTNYSLEKPSRVISGSARGISPACASSVLSSSTSTRTCSQPHGTAQGGKTPHFALSLPDPSPVRNLVGFAGKPSPYPGKGRQERCFPPASLRGAAGEREGVDVFNMFAHFRPLFLAHVSPFMQNMSPLFSVSLISF